MNLSLIDKIGTIFKYIFSSFLSIEMFVLSILLFLILVINLKRKNTFVQMIAIGIYIGFIIGIFVSYTTYVKTCVDSFIKGVMNYIYFPSTIVYFFIIVFVTIMILITLYSRRLTMFKKIINYLFFSILYFLFMSFIALGAYYGIDLAETNVLYQNDIILSIVQISNLLLLIWLIYTGFYHLYRYFKKKYD
ncbi:MAG: hypothetical protein IK137_02175 [Bacilli bacterium]|nr:hypothetical protein [Bacilli bacterium]